MIRPIKSLCSFFPSLIKFQDLPAWLDRTGDDLLDFVILVGVGDDDWRDRVITSLANCVQVDFNHRLPDLNLLALVKKYLESLSVKVDRVQTNVDQDFGTVI